MVDKTTEAPSDGGDSAKKDGSRALLEKSLLEIKRLRKKANEYQQMAHGPIAIVGVSCSFPGSVNNLEDLWEALEEGRDCVSKTGHLGWPWDEMYDKTPGTPGKTYTKAMGMIDEPIAFDTDFFGISPREVVEMDPQHRKLLEHSHRAIEDAGYSLKSLKGTDTGVFMGISSQDYGHMGARVGVPEKIVPWQGTGASPSAASGRVSYLFDFTGPSLPIDTACSSSLVALHTACQSLRAKDCRTALVGGVNIMMYPPTSILFASSRMLSADGYCRTFDADANGYVRSEAVSVVMLKRLNDAIKDGDHIYAVVRGTAVNCDGRSQGLTAPSELSQQKVIRSALKQADLKPEDITYVEAHGTGTPLGDPIEINAVQEVYGKSRESNNPIKIGSVKTNFGHAEAGAGMCGLLKLIVSFSHKKIPESLHFKAPNPFIEWSKMNVEVTNKLQDWPEGAPMRAGLSGFGFTGTNAHAIIEAYDPDNWPAVAKKAKKDKDKPVKWQPDIFTLSAKKQPALDDAEVLLTEYLKDDTYSVPAVSTILAVGRDHYHYRSACSSTDNTLYTGKKTKPSIATLFRYTAGTVVSDDDIAVLREQIPPFCAAWDDAQAVASKLSDEGLTGDEALFKAAVACFSYQYAISRMFIAWGIKPKILLSNELASNEPDTSATLTSERKVQILASELVAALTSGMFDVNVGLKYLAQLTDVCAGNSSSIDAMSCRRPRQQFLSQFVTEDNHTPVSFTVDKTAVKQWEEKLTAFASGQHADCLGKAELDLESSKGAWDASIVIDDTLAVATRDSIEVGVKPDVALFESGKGRTSPAAISSPHLQKLDSLLVQVYVSGVDVEWEVVFAQSNQPKLQLPTYSFQRNDYVNELIPIDLSNRPPPEGAEPFDSDEVSGPLPQWCYQYELENVKLLSDEGSLSKQWLIVADSESTANALSSQLVSRGNECSVYCLQRDAESLTLNAVGGAANIVNVNEAGVLQEWLNAKADGNPLNLVLAVGNATAAGDSDHFNQQYVDITSLTLGLSQALLRVGNVSFWAITANGLVNGIDGAGTSVSCSSTLLTGFSKSMTLELPGIMRGHLDYVSTNAEIEDGTASALADALMSELPGANLHFNGTEWQQPVLQRVSEESLPDTEAQTLNEDAIYLIIGGTGSLGVSVARKLIKRGAKNLVLISRSGVQGDADNYAELQSLRSSARVITPTLDISDRNSVNSLLSSLRKERPIGGIVHAAGLFEIATLQNLTPEACFTLMDNKVKGLRWLDELTEQDDLDFFVGFSSIASVWGSAGNFHYTAANYAVDAVIHQRRQRGKPGVVINWGPWADSNMVTDASELQANQRGLFAMDKKIGLNWFDKVVFEGSGDKVKSHQFVIGRIYWNRLKPLLGLTKMGSLLTHLSDPAGGEFTTFEAAEAELALQSVELTEKDIAFKENFESLPRDESQPAMLTYLTLQLSMALEMEPEDIDVYQPLLNLGIDSLMAMEFKNRVTKVTGVEVPLVRLLEGTNLVDLSQLLCDEYYKLQDGGGTLAEDTEDDEEFFEGAL